MKQQQLLRKCLHFEKIDSKQLYCAWRDPKISTSVLFGEWSPPGYFEYTKRVLQMMLEIDQNRICKYVILVTLRFLSKPIEQKEVPKMAQGAGFGGGIFGLQYENQGNQGMELDEDLDHLVEVICEEEDAANSAAE